MSEYLLQHGTRNVPQSQPLAPDQIQNSDGAFVWGLDNWKRLRRFLILGSEGGTYYVNERDLTLQNVTSVRECVAEDGLRAIAMAVEVSERGLAPKNDPALYVLATAISLGDKETRKAAAEALPRVARIGTHLFHFVAYAETMRGWGRTLRWAVSNWYSRNPEQAAFQGVKYRQRDGWSHRDLLRLSHPKASSEIENAIYSWMASDTPLLAGNDSFLPSIIHGFIKAQESTSPEQTAALVAEYRLPREALLSEHLTEPVVWEALLDAGMPMTALIRNLANMTRAGILKGERQTKVADQIVDQDAIRKARVHPMAILIALRTYAAGHGFRGTNTWTPLVPIIDALDEAFYLAFDNVVPTGKRHLLALDVSSSMSHPSYGGGVGGSPLTACEASAAMALVTLHAEKDVFVVGYSHEIVPLPLSRRQRLDDAVQAISGLNFGNTNCSLAYEYALRENLNVDTVITYTDSETNSMEYRHPKAALDDLRQRTGRAVSSVVVGMTSNGFSIADPSDPLMLDVVGMDASTPSLISEFVAGAI